MLWAYGRRTGRDLLSERAVVAWRQPPEVPQGLVDDPDLYVMRRLVRGPATLAQLVRDTGLPAAAVRRTLTCLQAVGSIGPVESAPVFALARRAAPAALEAWNGSFPLTFSSRPAAVRT